MNYCAPPEDKWLSVGLLKNTTQSCALLVVLYYLNKRSKPLVGRFSHRESRL